MKCWLDDVRSPRAYLKHYAFRVGFEDWTEWVWVKTAGEAIDLLKTNKVSHISLDHDLGARNNGTGYDVAKFIEEAAFNKTLPRLVWNIHSQNPIGRDQMRQALRNADRYWNNG